MQWQRPARDMRVLVATADAVAVGFNVPIAELLSGRQLDAHKDIRALGPDLLAGAGASYEYPSMPPRSSAACALADATRSRRCCSISVWSPGIGNVFKSEILFVAGIDPFTPVASLTDADLERIVGIARDQLAATVLDRSKTLEPLGRPPHDATASIRMRRCGCTAAAASRAGAAARSSARRRPGWTHGSPTGARSARVPSPSSL